MALTFSHLDTTVSTSSASTTASGSISPSDGDTLLVTYLIGANAPSISALTITSTLSGLDEGWRRYHIVGDDGTSDLLLVVLWQQIVGTPGSGTITMGGITSSRRVLHIDKVVGAKALYPVVNYAQTSQIPALYTSDPNISLSGATNDGTGTFGAVGYRDGGGSTSATISNRTSGGAAGPYTTLGDDRALATGSAVHRCWTGYQTSADTSLYSFVEADSGDVDNSLAILLGINDQTVGSGGGSPFAYGFAG